MTCQLELNFLTASNHEEIEPEEKNQKFREFGYDYQWTCLEPLFGIGPAIEALELQVNWRVRELILPNPPTLMD
jgi:hypothetical protein